MSIETKEFEAKISELTPTENNPRQISKKDFESLKKSLTDFPEMKSIREVVVDENFRILGGHIRVRALKELGEEVVPVKQVFGLTEDQKNEFVIRDNVQQGEWDLDLLANEWSDLPLSEWGLSVPEIDEFENVIEAASDNTINDFEDNTDYDLGKLYREKVSPEITGKIKEGVESGKIRPEIADVLQTRAKQCSIFDFDEIIKFYRSGDASEEEKELLRRLYLVFITPREAFERAYLKMLKISGEIYDDELTIRDGGEVEDGEA